MGFMCEINWVLLLDYVKVLLSWPVIALVTLLVFISRFKVAIDDLLGRLVEGNILGQGFKAIPPQQANMHSIQDDPLPLELAGEPDAAQAIAWVRSNPAQIVIEYKKLFFYYNSERLFTRIYGTQVALLEFLASRPDEPASLPLLAKFHVLHQQKVGSTAYQLRDYINFLVSYGVISVSGEDGSHTYVITKYGVEFLSYIKSNYPMNWNERVF